MTAGKGASCPQGLWTVEQAASYLALSERQVRRLVASGELPAVRIGNGSSRRAVRIRPSEVERLLRPINETPSTDLDAFIIQASTT